MSHDSIVNMIELVSIIVGGGLGIAGTVTETKTDKGKLTRWGWVAFIGIIIANTLSVFQNYFQQQKDYQEQLQTAIAERKKSEEAHAMYREQISRLTLIVNQSDSSLQQQQALRDQTGIVLADLGKSVSIQGEIFRQSRELTAQQQLVAGNIDRTLNPLVPFKINLELQLQSDSTSIWLMAFTKHLNLKVGEIIATIGSDKDYTNMTAKDLEYLKGEGLLPVSAGTRIYLVTKEYAGYKLLVNQMTGLQIKMSFSNATFPGGGSIHGEVTKQQIRQLYADGDLRIVYDADRQSYAVWLENLPVTVNSDLPIGSYGVKDLENGTFSFFIDDLPAGVLQSRLVFKFPPDFSRINRLKGTMKATNTLTDLRYYTYSYQMPVHFAY